MTNINQKIIPHLWFDKEAKEAADFYVSTFRNGSKVKDTTVIRNTPSGDCDFIIFDLLGLEFMAISAGPLFKFNPSISFLISCKTKEEVDELYERLSKEGKTLMALDSYPFSERYAWIQDKYGVSWQIILITGTEIRQSIVPTLMFTNNVCGKAEEAINFYTSIFHDSKIKDIMRYSKGQEPELEGKIAHASFVLENQEFAVMESAREHGFTFNEAISLLVNCDSQEEIDYYWEKLSADPDAEQCGWMKDKYGVSWQINPGIVREMLKDKDPQKVSRVTETFLKMKKFDIRKLKNVYEGK